MITQKYINDLAYKIVGCAIEVHKELGPGLLESVYEKCMCEQLSTDGLSVKSQVPVKLLYKGKDLDINLFLDLLVNDLVVVELKSVDKITGIHRTQLLTYLRLTNKPKGLIINFNTDNITKELVPLVTKSFSNFPIE